MEENLFYEPKNGYDRIDAATREAIFAMAEDYKTYLDNSRTERCCVSYSVKLAEAAGFVPYEDGMELKPGARVYANNRGKNLLLAVIGKRSLKEGVRIAAAHIDCPRLDLKPQPVTSEKGDLCLLRTHYYGGIKKYQWTCIPLALIGVVAMKDGSVVNVEMGLKPGDPQFVITDLLPHLGGDQMQKTLANGITGEGLKVLVGAEPTGDDKQKDRVKYTVLKALNELYGICEEDFLSAELSIVPAFNAVDIGFDRNLIGGYGQDDRSCAYGAVMAAFEQEIPEKTVISVLADKEEIGSVGSTGMISQYFDYFVECLCQSQGVSLRKCLANSQCLSADVNAAFDPLYPEPFEAQNAVFANYGVCLTKYCGSRGKGGANDAHAEFLGKLRRCFDDAGVIWQSGELGKVDAGGGGTVAGYMANRNIETVDLGVAVLSMHAPFEVVSKLDVYMTEKAMAAFYGMKD